MTDHHLEPHHNPLGLDGFEFVEFSAPEKGVLEPVFQAMGFTLVARHRSKDVELWRRWKALTSSRNVDLEDETSILDAAMDLAEGMDLPLSVVWAAIKSWVDQGLG